VISTILAMIYKVNIGYHKTQYVSVGVYQIQSIFENKGYVYMYIGYLSDVKQTWIAITFKS